MKVSKEHLRGPSCKATSYKLPVGNQSLKGSQKDIFLSDGKRDPHGSWLSTPELEGTRKAQFQESLAVTSDS